MKKGTGTVIRKRLQLFTVLGVMLLSTMVEVVTPAIAQAAATTANDRLKVGLYTRALAYCFANNDLQSAALVRQYISSDSVDSGNWFGTHGGGFAKRAYYAANGEGKDCTDPGWVKESIAMLGFKNGTDALKAYGFKMEDNGDMYFTAPREAIGNGVYDAVAKGPYGAAPSLDSPEVRYQLYKSLLYATEGCNATHTDEATIADGKNGARFKVVNPTPPPPTKDESVNFVGKDDGTKVIEFNNVNGVAEITCQEIANRIGQHAEAAAKYADTHKDETKDIQSLTPPGGLGTDGGEKSDCTVDAVGWIVCPVMTFLAKINDMGYTFLSDKFLTMPSKLYENNSPTHEAWKVFRNYANIMFVIAFLIIVYSQITTVGISNYGIKKMLPRLIVAAILVNLSFYICQLAVDLSNILGKSLYDVLITAGGGNIDTLGSGADWGWEKVIGGILATAAAGALLLLGLGVPVVVAALLALGMIILILIGREVAIVLLIILSPLAFVAYLLPNTNNLFTKWRKAFTALLLVYPIIGAVFGGSQLAAKIISTLGNEPGPATDVVNVWQLIALAATAIPMFVVPGLLKSSLKGLENVGLGKINSVASGLTDKAGKRAGKKFKDNVVSSRAGDYVRKRKRDAQIRNAAIKGGTFSSDRRIDRYTGRTVRSAANDYFNQSKVGRAAGGYAAASAGIEAANKIEDEEMKQAEQLIRYQSTPDSLIKDAHTALTDAVNNGDTARARAAASILRSTGAPGVQQLNRTMQSIQASGKGQTAPMQAVYKDVTSSDLKRRDNAIMQSALSNGATTVTAAATNSGTFRGLDESELGGQDAHLLDHAARQGLITADQAQAVLDNKNVTLSQDKRAVLENIVLSRGAASAAGGGGYTSPTSATSGHQIDGTERYDFTRGVTR